MEDDQSNLGKNEADGLPRLAHDLRNDLSVIYCYAQILEVSLSKQKMDKDKELARIICNSIKKMEMLIIERIDLLKDVQVE
ncbi:hypothetical protein H0X32_00810 [Patescibacteria group bacterium]|nr:hypothetical protein [Patescibacteria group bacterium]